MSPLAVTQPLSTHGLKSKFIDGIKAKQPKTTTSSTIVGIRPDDYELSGYEEKDEATAVGIETCLDDIPQASPESVCTPRILFKRE